MPKDMSVLANLAGERGHVPKLLNAVVEVNHAQPIRLIDRLEKALGGLSGAKIAVLGLTFKPNTDDLRYSSALEIIRELQSRDVAVTACDPQACYNPNRLPGGVEYVMDPFQAVKDCDAVILATEWPEYTSIDLHRLKASMAGDILADGRNAFDPNRAAEAGFTYIGVGRGVRLPAPTPSLADVAMLFD